MARKEKLFAEKAAPTIAQGIQDCAWASDGERCHYPGTISRSTKGMGPFYCNFHSGTDISAAYGAEVVVQSRNYKPRTMAERDHEAVFGPRTGPRACQERTCLLHAVPGMDLCTKHAAIPAEEIQRTGIVRRRKGDAPRAEEIAKRVM